MEEEEIEELEDVIEEGRAWRQVGED